MYSFLGRVALFGTFVWAVNVMVCNARTRGHKRQTESKLDDALDATYPASDPTATQDFAIPANRL